MLFNVISISSLKNVSFAIRATDDDVNEYVKLANEVLLPLRELEIWVDPKENEHNIYVFFKKDVKDEITCLRAIADRISKGSMELSLRKSILQGRQNTY